MNSIDRWLNAITMYKLVLYSLIAVSLSALGLSFFELLPYAPSSMLLSLATLSITCFGLNILLAKFFKATINMESSTISALILFLILVPPTTANEWLTLLAASALAMGSKYVIARRKKHLFNPVAFALGVLTLAGNPNVYWWVGSVSLLPIVAVTSFLLVRKLRRETMVGLFFAGAVVSTSVFGRINGTDLNALFFQVLTSWPLLFFAGFMLTEPLTTPGKKRDQVLYGSFVGLLFGSQYHVGPLYSTPEMALLFGNLISYFLEPRRTLVLQLASLKKIATDTFELAFTSQSSLKYLPGQYMEWTLPLMRGDARGNRRYFTLASSPTEQALLLGVRIANAPSSFKQALLSLKKGDTITAGHLAGDFLLPNNLDIPLVFVAGGIGITPFRSMIKYVLDKRQKRNITLFYANRHADEIVYKELFAQAKRELGINTIYLLSDAKAVPKNWSGEVGYLTQQMLEKYVPKPLDSRFYLSGPSSMVASYVKLLRSMGIKRQSIVKDYFPGF